MGFKSKAGLIQLITTTEMLHTYIHTFHFVSQVQTNGHEGCQETLKQNT
jgi:hypothetical protein